MNWITLTLIVGSISAFITALVGAIVLVLKWRTENDRDVWQRLKDCRDAEVGRLERALKDREAELERLRQNSNPKTIGVALDPSVDSV